jgi:glycosyltransferase involved in cell wall biosynthesis
VASALRRARERVAEALTGGVASCPAEILNVSAAPVTARSGGVAIQLRARLRVERTLRNVVLVEGGNLRESLASSCATAIHLEGTYGTPLAELLQLSEEGVAIVVSVHDFSLHCVHPHLLDLSCLDACSRCLDRHAHTRELARLLLQRARGVIFPSQYLLEEHRRLFSLPDLAGEVVEPSSASARVRGGGDAVAFAGSVKPHKGGRLLPEIAAMLAARGVDLHVFGGGDEDLLLALRTLPNVIIHGYYRSGTLPSLLARHRVGLVVLPSIWPEAHLLTMSEAWLAGARVAAFDLGAPAERIRRNGGGWLAPIESGAAGLIDIIDRWRAHAPHERVSIPVASPAGSAAAVVALYRKWRLCDDSLR